MFQIVPAAFRFCSSVIVMRFFLYTMFY